MKWLKESKQIVEEIYNNVKSVGIIETKNWLDKMGIKNYTIDKDGTVDVKGNVNL